jgi:magnesium chelatase family protein
MRPCDAASRRISISPFLTIANFKVARTIADPAGSGDIQTTHLTEALSYRRLDRAPVQ